MIQPASALPVTLAAPSGPALRVESGASNFAFALASITPMLTATLPATPGEAVPLADWQPFAAPGKDLPEGEAETELAADSDDDAPGDAAKDDPALAWLTLPAPVAAPTPLAPPALPVAVQAPVAAPVPLAAPALSPAAPVEKAQSARSVPVSPPTVVSAGEGVEAAALPGVAPETPALPETTRPGSIPSEVSVGKRRDPVSRREPKADIAVAPVPIEPAAAPRIEATTSTPVPRSASATPAAVAAASVARVIAPRLARSVLVEGAPKAARTASTSMPAASPTAPIEAPVAQSPAVEVAPTLRPADAQRPSAALPTRPDATAQASVAARPDAAPAQALAPGAALQSPAPQPGAARAELTRADPGSVQPIVVPIAPASSEPVPFNRPVAAAASFFAAQIESALTPPRAVPRDLDSALLAAAGAREPRAAAVPVAMAAEAQQAPLDMRRQEWTGRMIEVIDAMRDAAPVRETRLSLMPEALGKVDVTVRQEGDRVHVHIATETQAARQMIADAQPRLQEIAEQRGIKLGQTSVESSGGGAQPQSGQRHDAAPRSPAQQPSAPPSAGSRAAANPDDDSAERIA